MHDTSSDEEHEYMREVLETIRAVATDEQFSEFARLLRELAADEPEVPLSGKDISDLFATAMFNLGDITREEIDRVQREVFGDDSSDDRG